MGQDKLSCSVDFFSGHLSVKESKLKTILKPIFCIQAPILQLMKISYKTSN